MSDFKVDDRQQPHSLDSGGGDTQELSDKAGSGKEGLLLAPERHDSKNSTWETGQQEQQEQLGSDAILEAAALRNQQAFGQNNVLPTINTAITHAHPALPHRSSPKHSTPAQAAGLHLMTNVESPSALGLARLRETPTIYETPVQTEATLHQSLTSPMQIPGAGSSLRSTLSASSLASSISPGSTLPSPYLAAMSDLTPLPSPLVGSDVPGPWRRGQPGTPQRSRQSSLAEEATPTASDRRSSLPTAPASPSPTKRKKGYGSLVQEATLANASAVHENAQATTTESKGHGRNRSISDFVPEALHNTRHRHVTFGPGDAASIEARQHDYRMQREAYLAAQRGLTTVAAPPTTSNEKGIPTPPPSTSSVADSEEPDDEPPCLEDGTPSDYLEIHCGIHHKRRKFRQLRELGTGTFSKVMLATRERIPAHPTPEIEERLDPHQLVAVKIVEHGPAGGADEKRIETSLKREVEMLKSVSHPSLIHLKACEYTPSRALLVLTYCPGGDLFELASQKREVLTPPMCQRMFAELVGAVRYLHAHWIVHRDIKLENVLVNLPTPALLSITNPLTHPTPVVTLTDLGLSRRIPDPPESPLLTTRCGSEDYAAPEILLGQPYDGRLTDAWALGVLLYALLEGRLPFDAPPGKIDRSRNTHRIARCDWIWCRFGDEDGEWDPIRAGQQGYGDGGARDCVEGLLCKVRANGKGRKGVEEILQLPWVQDGIRVEGGLQVREDDGGEVL